MEPKEIIAIWLLFQVVVNGQYNPVYENDVYFDQLKCPEYWVQFQQSCYRFIKSPSRPFGEARRICEVSRFAYIIFLANKNFLF